MSMRPVIALLVILPAMIMANAGMPRGMGDMNEAKSKMVELDEETKSEIREKTKENVQKNFPDSADDAMTDALLDEDHGTGKSAPEVDTHDVILRYQPKWHPIL